MPWLPGRHDYIIALGRLGFRPPFPGPRILNPCGVPSIPAASPLQSGPADTSAGGPPGTALSPTPTPGGSAQRPRRGKRGAPAAPAPAPAEPLHNLRLLLRSMEEVLRRDGVCPLLTRLHAAAWSAILQRLVSLTPADVMVGSLLCPHLWYGRHLAGLNTVCDRPQPASMLEHA